MFFLTFITIIIFEFVNGFHDTANAVATAVHTRALSGRRALILAGIMNFIGALLGTKVAVTMGTQIFALQELSADKILCAMLAGISWNLITWYMGFPSSSTHGLIGGLTGAILFSGGVETIKLPMYISVLGALILGPLGAAIISAILVQFIAKSTWGAMLPYVWVANYQRVSAGLQALAHGLNDAQKSMGILAALLVSEGYLQTFYLPMWLKFLCALTLGVGTYVGGWRIISTLGREITQLTPKLALTADLGGIVTINLFSLFGLPVSTSHVVAASIGGTGAGYGHYPVNYRLLARLASAWLITLPITSLISFCLMFLVT